MGGSKKWIDSEPDETVRQIASRVLDSRLQRLWHFLVQSVREPATETENVHQLRVFTRRSTAALEIFEPWLPRKLGRKVTKRVNKVRKAAGAARDLDVLRLRVQKRLDHAQSSSTEMLLELIVEHRRGAQQPIEKLHEHLSARRFDRKIQRLVKRVRESDRSVPEDAPFDVLARRALQKLAEPYLEAASAELTDSEALHAFRIQGKQVRYAMELFAGAFDAEFRQELYPIVAMLQDRLGTINDHVTAEALFAEWRDQTESHLLREALQVGIDEERAALAEARKDFLNWWAPWRRDDLRRRFSRYVPLENSSAADVVDEAGH